MPLRVWVSVLLSRHLARTGPRKGEGRRGTATGDPSATPQATRSCGVTERGVTSRPRMAIPGAFRCRFALSDMDGPLRGVPAEKDSVESHRVLGRSPALTIESDRLVVSSDPAIRRSQSAIARAMRRLRGDVLLPDHHAFHSTSAFASLLRSGDLLDIALDPMARSSLMLWRAGALVVGVGSLRGTFESASVRVTIAASPDGAAAIVVRAGDETVRLEAGDHAALGTLFVRAIRCTRSGFGGPSDHICVFDTARVEAPVGDAFGYDFSKVGG